MGYVWVVTIVAGVIAAEGGLSLSSRVKADKIVPSMQFVRNPDGAIHLKANPELILSIRNHTSPEVGDKVVLRKRDSHDRNRFNLSDGLIRIVEDPDMCLNVKDGEAVGPISSWPCEHDGKRVPHEEFTLGEDGRIRLTHNSDKCISVKDEKFQVGAEVVLAQCVDYGENALERFVYIDSMLRLKFQPHLCLGLSGRLGGEDGGMPHLVLSSCTHQAFEFKGNGQVRLRAMHDANLCLNGKEGALEGHEVVSWFCTESEPGGPDAFPPPNERFAFDEGTSTIYAISRPELVFDVGPLEPGHTIVLRNIDRHDEL